MDDETFPGQLVEYSEHGHTFRYSAGAKGGVILGEDDKRIGKFFIQDVGDGDTPLGLYVQSEVTNPHREGYSSNYVYADNLNGASAYLIGYEDGRGTAAPTDVLLGLTEDECLALISGTASGETDDLRHTARIKIEEALNQHRGIISE